MLYIWICALSVCSVKKQFVFVCVTVYVCMFFRAKEKAYATACGWLCVSLYISEPIMLMRQRAASGWCRRTEWEFRAQRGNASVVFWFACILCTHFDDEWNRKISFRHLTTYPLGRFWMCVLCIQFREAHLMMIMFMSLHCAFEANYTLRLLDCPVYTYVWYI